MAETPIPDPRPPEPEPHPPEPEPPLPVRAPHGRTGRIRDTAAIH